MTRFNWFGFNHYTSGLRKNCSGLEPDISEAVFEELWFSAFEHMIEIYWFFGTLKPHLLGYGFTTWGPFSRLSWVWQHILRKSSASWGMITPWGSTSDGHHPGVHGKRIIWIHQHECRTIILQYITIYICIYILLYSTVTIINEVLLELLRNPVCNKLTSILPYATLASSVWERWKSGMKEA